MTWDPKRLLRRFRKIDYLGFAITIICVIFTFLLHDMAETYDVISPYGMTMDVDGMYALYLAMTQNMLIISGSILFKRLTHE